LYSIELWLTDKYIETSMGFFSRILMLCLTPTLTPARHRQGAPSEPRNHAQHPAESFLCVHLQRVGDSHRSGCALSDLRHVAKSGDRQCRHDLQFGIRNHQRVEVE